MTASWNVTHLSELLAAACKAPGGTLCGSCVPCTAAAELERLRGELSVLRSRRADVEWCVTHHGVRNEDEHRCDMWDEGDCPTGLDDWDDEHDADHCLDCACDLRPLFYGEATDRRHLGTNAVPVVASEVVR